MWPKDLLSEEGQKEIAKVKELTKIAERGEGTSVTLIGYMTDD